MHIQINSLANSLASAPRNIKKAFKQRLSILYGGDYENLLLWSTAYHFVNYSYHIFPCYFFANCADLGQFTQPSEIWRLTIVFQMSY